MGNYKPFFIRQRAARHEKSPVRVMGTIDPNTGLPSISNSVTQPSYSQPQSQIASLNTADGSQELDSGQQADQLGINTSDFVSSMYKPEPPALDRNQRIQARIDAIGEDGNQAKKARLTKKLNKRKARQANRAANIQEREKKQVARIQERGKPKEKKKKEEK